MFPHHCQRFDYSDFKSSALWKRKHYVVVISMSLQEVCITWVGPFAMWETDELQGQRGVYLLVGKRRREFRKCVQYCGHTTVDFRSRITHSHHAVKKLKRDVSIWIGTLSSEVRIDKRHIVAAEATLIYTGEFNLNVQGRNTCNLPIPIRSIWKNRSGKRCNNPPSGLSKIPRRIRVAGEYLIVCN